NSVLLRQPSTDRHACAHRPLRAPALGDRAAVSGTEDRTWAGSFRGPHVSGLASPRRAHGCRPTISSRPSDGARARPDLPDGVRDGARDLHRVSLRATPALSQTDRRAPLCSAANLTK